MQKKNLKVKNFLVLMPLFETVMPDGKALQMGTSHMLSQNFAKVIL